MIDTHAHLSKEYYDDVSLVIDRAISNDVKKIIVSGCTKKDIVETVNLIKKYDCLYATIGYHPEEAGCITDQDISALEKDILSNPKIIGIGEIGLDYHYGKENREEQLSLFDKQLSLAEKLKLPVVIHSRDATMDTYELLKKHNVRGIIHCFSSSLEVANQYIKLGFLLGIGGVITFKNCKLKEVLASIDLEHVVLETDSPYLSPVPFRGKTNEPSYIYHTADFIAKLKNISIEEVDRITTRNVFGLFDLK